jgi:hypothetical protein
MYLHDGGSTPPFSHRNTKIKNICGSEYLCQNSRIYFVSENIKSREDFSKSDMKIQMVCTSPVSLSLSNLMQ